jgi:hypothetical protein
MPNPSLIIQGLRNEERLFPLIKELYGDDLNKIDGMFAPFDYQSPTKLIELKSRNLNHNKYPTTMVGYNKIELAKLERDRKVIFLFAFYDGLYEWEYTDKNFEEIGGVGCVLSRPGYVNTSNTYFNPNKEHLYIPVDKLIKRSEIK